MKRLYTATAGVLLLCSTALAFNFDFSFRFVNKSGGQYIDLAPGLEWSTNAYEFGSHDVGTTTNHSFTLTNNGTDTAEDVTVSTSLPFRIYSSTVFGNISASRSRTVKVEYKPTAAGAHAAMLNYSAPNISPVGVALTGTGTSSDLPTTPVISVTPGDTTNLIALTSGGVGATSFDLLWGLSAGSEPNTISSVSLPYTHTGRTNGTPYYYKLAAVNGNGTATSSEVSGTPNLVTYSDDFTGTDNTALATHDANWMSPGATYTVGGFKLNSNQVQTTSTYTQAGAYYNTSTSDTSQIVSKALSNTSQTVDKFVCVRMDSAHLGYCAEIKTLSGGNWTTSSILKESSLVSSTCTGLSIPAGSDHKLALTASGTSIVTLTLYVDDTQICQKTDSTATYTTGHPGFRVSGNGTVGNNVFDDWKDYRQ